LCERGSTVPNETLHALRDFAADLAHQAGELTLR
jgi:hypothetical protein